MICNRDCFNCIHPDCIRGENADINEQKAEWRRKNPEKRKAIRRRYYLNHRESELDYLKRYRITHSAPKVQKPKIFNQNDYMKQYRADNAERLKEYKREYRMKNKEQIAQKDHEYYLRRKQERQAV